MGCNSSRSVRTPITGIEACLDEQMDNILVQEFSEKGIAAASEVSVQQIISQKRTKLANHLAGQIISEASASCASTASRFSQMSGSTTSESEQLQRSQRKPASKQQRCQEKYLKTNGADSSNESTPRLHGSAEEMAEQMTKQISRKMQQQAPQQMLNQELYLPFQIRDETALFHEADKRYLAEELYLPFQIRGETALFHQGDKRYLYDARFLGNSRPLVYRNSKDLDDRHSTLRLPNLQTEEGTVEEIAGGVKWLKVKVAIQQEKASVHTPSASDDGVNAQPQFEFFSSSSGISDLTIATWSP